MSHEGPDAAEGVDEIRLTLPAQVPYGRVVRLAVTGMASRNGYPYDDVEDLRIAVGELWAVLVDPAATHERLVFRCFLRSDALEITASKTEPDPLRAVSGLTRQILAAVVDEADIDEGAGHIRILKRLRS